MIDDIYTSYEKGSSIRVRHLPYDMISILGYSQAEKTTDFDSVIGGSNPSTLKNSIHLYVQIKKGS